MLRVSFGCYCIGAAASVPATSVGAAASSLAIISAALIVSFLSAGLV